MAPLTEIENLAAQLMAKEGFAKALALVEAQLFAAMATENPALLTQPVSSAAVIRARNLANTAARTLTEQLSKSQLSAMGDVIADGLIAGKRPGDLYNKLDQVKSLDSVRARRYLKLQEKLEDSGMSSAQIEKTLEREYQRLLKERRKTIARTEGRYATSEARRASADERQNKWKAWITSRDEKVSDICAGNEADGVIPIDKAFSSGAMQTPGHPNCRCTVAYYPDSKKVLDIVERRQKNRIEKTRKAREGEADDAE